MSYPLTGKVAVITGASKGSGKAIAEKLSAQGATVVINYSRDSAPAEALAKLGADRSHSIKANISGISKSKRLVSETVAKYGKIDILVLNAGVLPEKTLEATTEEDFDRVFCVNVKGPYFLTQAAAPHIPDGGRVIFLSTSATVISSLTPEYLLYVSSKGPIEQMTRMIAKDLGRRSITANCVSPGPTDTEMLHDGSSEDFVKTIASLNPMNRMGTPDDIAKVTAFLAGPESSAFLWFL